MLPQTKDPSLELLCVFALSGREGSGCSSITAACDRKYSQPRSIQRILRTSTAWVEVSLRLVLGKRGDLGSQSEIPPPPHHLRAST
jgi:hypothetical protein